MATFEIATPDWMLEMKRQEEVAAAQQEAKDLREANAGLVVKEKGHPFWKEVRKELSVATSALPQFGLLGAVTQISTSGAEESIRVTVRRGAMVQNGTYTDLFYRPGDSLIRRHTIEGGVNALRICVDKDGTVGVMPDDSFDLAPLNPEKTARAILLPMMKKVRS